MRAIRRPAGPTRRRRPSRRFLQVIKQRTDCRDQHHHRRRPYMTIEERVRPAATFKPEVASLNMGSMNFGLFPMLDRYKDVQASTGRGRISRDRATSCSRTPSRTSNTSWRPAPRTARASSSSATTSAISTICPFPRPRPGQAAVLRPVRVRHPGRHRPASRGRRCT